MSGPYNFKKDGASDDGKELSRYLSETTGSTTGAIHQLAAGNYRIVTGQHVGPGSLGILPPNARYRLEPVGYTLIVS